MAVSTTEAGRAGETLAMNYLIRKGYTVLARNYRSGKQEIDLICEDGKILVFVEVKARTSRYFGPPSAAITARKQAFLRKAALSYLVEHHSTDQFARFDAVEVNLQNGQITHIQDAF